MQRSSWCSVSLVLAAVLSVLVSPVFGVSTTMMDADGNDILDMDNFSMPFSMPFSEPSSAPFDSEMYLSINATSFYDENGSGFLGADGNDIPDVDNVSEPFIEPFSEPSDSEMHLSINGTNFYDENGNGFLDPGEPGLPGWTIRLILDGDEIANAVTDDVGGYRFSDLAPGSYIVLEDLQPEWNQTAPGGGWYEITLTDKNAQRYDFGNYNGSVDRLLAEFEHPLMRPSPEQMKRWVEEYEAAPLAPLDPNVTARLDAEPLGYFSLLGRLKYTPSERDQGYCGDCWAWAGTGVMEIGLNVQRNIKDRLSIQYLNSNFDGGSGGDWACCGGWLSDVANFYSASDKAIPWTNANAHWQDGARSCEDYQTSVPGSAITTSPSYPVNSIEAQSITTFGPGVTQEQAISNIKNVLNQNKAVWFAFFLPTNDEWNAFTNFWSYQPETAVWNPSFPSGKSLINGEFAGHAVLCVGYDDTNRCWIMLNSWGAPSNRPNGLFRVSMDMDYDDYMSYGSYDYYAFYWQTLDIEWGNAGNVYGAVLTADRFGKPNNAYYFDGIDDYIYAPVNINPDVMPKMTMTAWVKANDVAAPIRQVISSDNGGFDRTVGIIRRSGVYHWSAFSGSGGTLDACPFVPGEWEFLAVVYDQNAQKVKLYVNGDVYQENGVLGLGHEYFFIGANPSYGEYFSGVIDDVCIYNRALSDADIQELYLRGFIVAYYPFSGNAYDAIWNGHHGTVYGAALTADRFGKPNNAYYFDGIDDYIYAPVNINPDVMPKMTMTAWVKANDVAAPIRQVISSDNGGFDRTVGIIRRSGVYRWSAFSGSGGTLDACPFVPGEWEFLAVVYDQNAQTVKLYVNGDVYQENGVLRLGHEYFSIGANPSYGEYFSGVIDDVRIYNQALSDADIQDLYIKGSLMAYYPFEGNADYEQGDEIIMRLI